MGISFTGIKLKEVFLLVPYFFARNTLAGFLYIMKLTKISEKAFTKGYQNFQKQRKHKSKKETSNPLKVGIFMFQG